MKKVLLVIGLGILLLFLGKVGYEVYKNVGSRFLIGEREAVSSQGLTRNYPTTIKSVMISTPGVEKRTLEEHGKDMKEMGINTVQFIMLIKKAADGHFYPAIGPLPGSLQLNYYKNLIVEAKKQGFAVWVSPGFPASGMNYPLNLRFDSKEEWEKGLVEGTVELAQVFEDYQVEYYSPLVEPDLILVNNNFTGTALNEELARLADTVYPQVRKVFKGKIIAKVTEARTVTPQPSKKQPDFEGMWTAEGKGADILGLDSLPPFQGLDSYKQMIREQFIPASKVSANLAIPWMIAEYAQGMSGVTGEGSSWNTQALKEVFDQFLASQPKPIGFSFNFWDFVEGEKNKTVKETFREFYLKF